MDRLFIPKKDLNTREKESLLVVERWSEEVKAEVSEVAADLASHTHVALVPTGGIIPYGGPTTPSGWLLCNGQTVSQTTYAALYAVVGDRYAGIGAIPPGDFRIPDLMGRVPVGRDASQVEFDVLGEEGGAKTHQLTPAEMPSHTHQMNFPTIFAAGTGRSGAHVNADASKITSTSAGSDQPHNNLQPYLTINYIIKT